MNMDNIPIIEVMVIAIVTIIIQVNYSSYSYSDGHNTSIHTWGPQLPRESVEDFDSKLLHYLHSSKHPH